jgi:hypothetical protein
MSVRYMTENFVDADVISNRVASSAQSAFPVSNIENKQRRSKVWRTNGYWNIEAGVNDVIIFQETAATPLTATIADAEYTSSTAFFAAIKTALEAAGASTYTVAHSSELKISITSDGAGGGNIFELLTTSGSFTAEDEIGFSSATDFTGALTYTGDFLKIHGSEGEWIRWDMGISSNPQAFILTGPRNRELKISPTATIKLQGNETNSWASPSYEQTLTYDDSVIIQSSTTGLHTEALRYWRINIIDQNPLGYIEIGAAFLGDYTIPTQGKAQFPFQSQYVDRTETLFSEGGQTFSEIREQSQSFAIRWQFLNVADIETWDEVFAEFGTGVPFFIQYDIDAVFNSKTNKSVRYVKFQRAPAWALQRPKLFVSDHSFLEQL